MDNKTTPIALFFVRSLLGIIFFWQGFGKVFTFGLSNLYESIFKVYEELGFPEFILKSILYFTSFGELFGGALLILGLFRKWTYLLFISILLVVSIGHGIKDPIWDLQHVIFRALLLSPLLIIPLVFDKYSLDHLLKR